MPGPRNAYEARTWIQEAVAAGRYVPSKHLFDQKYNRGLSIDDVFVAVERMTRIEVYKGTPEEPAVPRHDGTCWRVFGPNVDDDCVLAVGFEAYLDKARRRVVVVTLFRVSKE